MFKLSNSNTIPPDHFQVTMPSNIQYVDREVIKEIPVEVIREVEKVIYEPAEKIDLSPVHERIDVLDTNIRTVAQSKKEFIITVCNELEMQRRALIAIKTQRDIDRSRRLMLLKRMKKEQLTNKKMQIKLQVAIAVSLLLSVVSILIKL